MPSTHINVFPGPGPYKVSHQPANKCAVIRFEGTAHLNLFLHSPEEADALIVAAVQAKKLLAGEPALPALTCNLPVDGHPCTRAAGHSGHCLPPGGCTCGATAGAHGAVEATR